MIAKVLPSCSNRKITKEIYKSLNIFFSRLDAFSQKPVFRVLEQQAFSTVLGQLMTLILMTLCLFSFASSLLSTINHNSPSIMQSQEVVVETSPYPFIKNNFTLALTFLDSNQTNLVNTSQYIQTVVQNCLIQRHQLANSSLSISRNCTTYSIQICDHESSFQSESQKSFFSTRNLTNYYCINSSQWDQKPINLQGSSQSNQFQFVTLTTIPCRNSTANNNTCQSTEKINSYIQGVYYLFMIDGVLSQVSNFTDPFQQYIAIKSTQLSMSQSKQINHNLNINEVNTDTGLIFKEQQKESSIGLQDIQIESNTFNGQYLSMHMISITGIKYTYSRSYTKLQTILGQLGGLWQVTVIIFGMFINPLTRKMLYLNMANGLFDLKYESQSTGILNSKSLENAAQEKRAMREFFKKRGKSIQIDLRTLCSFIFSLRSTKRIQNAHLKIMSKLDLQYILNKMIEIDQLKEVLFTEEQNQLFRYLQRPQINQNVNKPFDELIEQAHQAYLKTYEDYNQRQINQNLIVKLDPELLDIFQHLNQKGVNQICSPLSERISIQDHPDEVVELESKAQRPKYTN